MINGINCTILAYGQTGSGKTFTMLGKEFTGIQSIDYNSDNKGVIPNSIDYIFSSFCDSSKFTIYASLVQIYNEKLYDLLQDAKAIKPLNLVESKISGIFVG